MENDPQKDLADAKQSWETFISLALEVLNEANRRKKPQNDPKRAHPKEQN
jgi:hypothetical protein